MFWVLFLVITNHESMPEVLDQRWFLLALIIFRSDEQVWEELNITESRQNNFLHRHVGVSSSFLFSRTNFRRITSLLPLSQSVLSLPLSLSSLALLSLPL